MGKLVPGENFLNKIYCTARGVVGALHITIVVACVQFVSGFQSICTQNLSAEVDLSGLNVFMYYGPTVFKKIFHTQGSFCSINMLFPATIEKMVFLHYMLICFEVHRSCLQPCWELKYQKKMPSFVLVTHSAGLKVWPCKLPEHISCSSASFPERHSKTCHSMPMDLINLARLCALWTELAAQPFCSLQRLE